MSKVRLREATPASDNGATPPEPIPLKPLRVSGVVVRKADLIEALRIYVRGLTDLQVTEDGEHFWLIVGETGEEGRDEDPTARQQEQRHQVARAQSMS